MSVQILGQEVRRSLERVLQRVMRPARYTGGEWGAVSKDPAAVDVRVALAFPDVYEIGMSNLGLRILYHVINERPEIFAERVFAPWPDMEHELRDSGLPLYSLETFSALSEFDIIGFSLSYEMTCTNVLNMLDLAGIPLRAEERTANHPLVIAGGHCAFNPEPMAAFIDAFVIGEGEDSVLELIDSYRNTRGDRRTVLEALARVSGVYVPSLYAPEYGTDGHLKRISSAHDDAPGRVEKRAIDNFDAVQYPETLIVPFLETVHDRAALEIMRGCTHGCRFCQAGMITRPVREKSRATLEDQARKLTASTGYDEIALTSLSSADYTGISDLVHELIDEHEPSRIGVSLPSLRADSECVMLAADIERVRKTGLTFAPEAGTQRLRDVINKNVTLEDLLGAVEAAVKSGWRKVKLYFMIGLPTETDEDVLAIADVVKAVLARAKEHKRPIAVNVGVSSFVPKPHTPFQWRAQDDLVEIQRKLHLLKDSLRIKGVSLSWHDPETSRIEAALSRGDRQVGDAIYNAWRLGARFDGWDEHFDYGRWLGAFDEAGLEPAYYANRIRGYDEPLPWDHIDSGVTKRYLVVQDRLADKAQPLPDCRSGPCSNCGIQEMLPPGVDDCWQQIRAQHEKAEPPVGVCVSGTRSPKYQTPSRGEGCSEGSGRPSERHRFLLTFVKGDGVRWLGHLDLLRTFERAVRRADLPLSYSEGFNPRPRMSFASALGVGVTGSRELMILELSTAMHPKEIARLLNSALPPGITIVEVRAMLPGEAKSLNPKASDYEVVLSGADPDSLREAVRRLLARSDVFVERKKDRETVSLNIRPSIEFADVSVESGASMLVMRLKHGQVTAKAVEVVQALAEDLPELQAVRVHRKRVESGK